MMQAISLYRSTFRPSARLDKPYVMLGFNVFAADTDDKAQLLASSMQQAFVSIRTGHPTRLQPPVKDYVSLIGPNERAILDQVLPCSAVGSPETVARELRAFIAQTGADELMITSQIFDHAARVRSYEITANVREHSALS
jgi:alkanesulfonate monooxygenase SsuD/methylene tetrahydromethanopterin reductase-like flavin-dependent oxidoreductase (luciferase family)